MASSSKKLVIGVVGVAAIAFAVHQFVISPGGEATDDAMAWNDNFGTMEDGAMASRGRTHDTADAMTGGEVMAMAGDCMKMVRDSATSQMEFPSGAYVDTADGRMDLADISRPSPVSAFRVSGRARSGDQWYDWSCDISPNKQVTLNRVDRDIATE